MIITRGSNNHFVRFKMGWSKGEKLNIIWENKDNKTLCFYLKWRLVVNKYFRLRHESVPRQAYLRKRVDSQCRHYFVILKDTFEGCPLPFLVSVASVVTSPFLEMSHNLRGGNDPQSEARVRARLTNQRTAFHHPVLSFDEQWRRDTGGRGNLK